MDNPDYRENPEYQEFLTDYSILYLSDRQYRAIQQITDIVNEVLDIDRVVLYNIICRYFIQEQQDLQRFQSELEIQFPQIRMKQKMDFMKYAIKQVKAVLNGSEKQNLVETAINNAFQWYKNEYL